jgi:outer membrane cobalamin receptor
MARVAFRFALGVLPVRSVYYLAGVRARQMCLVEENRTPLGIQAGWSFDFLWHPTRNMNARFFYLLCAARIGIAQQPQTPQQLDTIRVTAAPLTRTIQIISRDDIRKLGTRTIPDVLARATAADLQSRSPMQADIAIRGTSLGQVLVLVDGVRMTDRQTPHFDLDIAVPIDQVERIEILRGPASAQYGADAVGGVVNIVTTQSRTLSDLTGSSVEARGGSFGTVGASLALPRISADHERSDGHRLGTDYRSTVARAAVGNGTLGGSVGQAVRDFGANSFYGPYDSHERTAATTAEVHAERPLSGGRGGALAANVSASTRRHLDQFTLRRTDPSFYRNRHESWQSALTTFVRGPRVAIGAELNEAQLTSNRLGSRRERTGATFGQVAIGSTDLGVRSDWSSGFGTFVSPSVATSFAVSDKVRLSASASRAFRAPSWTERYYSDPANVGNPDLKAERFLVGEVGARMSFLSVAGWARRGTDVIDWVKPADSLAAVWRTRNISRVNFRGADAEVTAAGGRVAVNGSVVRFEAPAATGYVGKYALRPLTSSVGFRADMVRRERGTFTVDGRRFRRATEGEAHVVANAHFEVRVRDARLGVTFDNFVNAAYLDVAGRPIAPRSLMVTAAWR